MSSVIFKTEVLIKLVSNIYFHIIFNSFLLHSYLKYKTPPPSLKAIHTHTQAIHWLFSMGFVSVFSIRRIKTMTDDNSYKDGSGKAFLSWRGLKSAVMRLNT